MHSEQAAPDLLQKSLDASGVGWWQLDFGQREMTCSRLAADLFGADRTRISFEEVYLLPGEEHRARIYTRCAALKASLPAGVEVVPTYDRSQLIERAVGNLKRQLVEEFVDKFFFHRSKRRIYFQFFFEGFPIALRSASYQFIKVVHLPGAFQSLVI